VGSEVRIASFIDSERERTENLYSSMAKVISTEFWEQGVVENIWG